MPSTRQSRKSEPEPDLAAELKAARARISELERELANREFDLRAFEARIAAVNAAAKEQIEAAEAEATERVLAIYRSSSWRLTGPLRRATRLIGRLRPSAER